MRIRDYLPAMGPPTAGPSGQRNLNATRLGIAAAIAASVVAALPAVASAGTPEHTGPPQAMAVLGDSISAGTDADNGTLIWNIGKVQKENSWATGTTSSINSYYQRLLAINPAISGRNSNKADNGKKMTDMVSQANSIPNETELVLVQLGGNDLCKDTVGQMTSTDTYRQQFVAGLNAIAARTPSALILISSVPDIFNLWFIRGAPSPPQDIVSGQAGNARTYWDTLGVIPCKSLVDNPTDMSDAANLRRSQVRQRNLDYNAILAEECAKVIRCRFDGNGLFNFSSNRIDPNDNPVNPFSPSMYTYYLPRSQWQFLDADISTVDHFHPSQAGQSKLAKVAWEAGFDWNDATPPAIASIATSPAPLTTSGVFRNKPTVTIGYSDTAGVKGIEYRADSDGNPGDWRTALGSSVSVEAVGTGVNSIETRAIDRNGNLSASQTKQVTWDPNATAIATAPRSLATSQVSYREARVTWETPADDGASPITGYRVERSGDGGSTWVDALGGLTSQRTASVTGLNPATPYRFRVKAINAVGMSAASEPASATTRALTVPNLPTGASGKSKPGSVELSWDAPDDDGGLPITAYTVTASPKVLGVTRSCTTATRSCTVNGLVNGESYSFSITATNPLGTSVGSTAAGPVVPLAPPSAPFITLATGGTGQATVQWSAPDSDGGRPVTAYTVSASPQVNGATRSCSTTAPTTACTVTGLLNGTAYRFTVTATNDQGTGIPSGESIAVTPRSVPGIPVITGATAADRSAVISWSPPGNGGAAITLYTVTAAPTVDGITKSCTTTSESETSCTVTGLRNGTAYTFAVTATNSQGTGQPSESSSPITPKAVPGAPTAVKATGGNGTASVTWTAPSSVGGSPLSGYTVSASPSVSGSVRGCSTAGATSCSVSGLVNGTAYTFTVVASNEAGDGPVSSPSAAVTPAGPPAPPTVTGVTAGNGSATVTWDPPASDGGSQLNGYTVSASPAVNGAFKTCSTALNLSGLARTCTITGLSNGTEYTFTVGASNRAGLRGLPSAISDPVTPATVPGSPFITAAVAGNGSVTVSWNAPTETGGAPVIDYLVSASPSVGGATRTCLATGSASCSVAGLTNGIAYTFTVTARNRVGTGAPSGVSIPATPSLPLPTTVSAKTGLPVLSSSAVTMVTAVTAPRAGKIVLTAKLKQGSKTTSVCTVNQTVSAFGTVNLTCKGSSAVRSALKKAAGVVTITTVFTPTSGAGSQVVESVNIAKKA